MTSLLKDRARMAALLVVFAGLGGTAYVLSGNWGGDPLLRTGSRAVPLPAPPTRASAVEHWTADILARPLIYPLRRAPAPAAVAEAQAAPEPPPRLTGVIVGPARRSALFITAQGGRPIAVEEGAHIGAYTVRSIRLNEVVIDGPDGTRALQPSFSAGGGAPAPVLPKRADRDGPGSDRIGHA